MEKKKLIALLLPILLLVLASIAIASGAADEGSAEAAATGIKLTESIAIAIAIAAGSCITIAAAFGTLAQSKALGSALEGIARNPGAADKITTPMIIGLAMIESLVIYALVISLMLVLNLKFI